MRQGMRRTMRRTIVEETIIKSHYIVISYIIMKRALASKPCRPPSDKYAALSLYIRIIFISS